MKGTVAFAQKNSGRAAGEDIGYAIAIEVSDGEERAGNNRKVEGCGR